MNGLCSQKGFPKKGWKYEGVYDAKSDNGDLVKCEFCDKAMVRYVHVLSHEEWDEPIHVGCECAVSLQSDYSEETLRKKEASLKSNLGKMERFIDDTKWTKGKTKNQYTYFKRIYKKFEFVIWKQNDGRFTCSKIKLYSRYYKNYGVGYYSESFKTIVEAKMFLYDEFIEQAKRR